MVKFVDSATTIMVKDVVASEAFSREKLGFNASVFYGELPTFSIVWRDKVTVFLDAVPTPHPIPLNQYWAFYIYVDDVDAMFADVKRRGVAIDRDIESQDYGYRNFDIRDPDGHFIGIGQNLTKKNG